MLSAVGKFFAALILVGLLGWLAPMCARLPDDLTTIAAPAASAVTISPLVSTAPVTIALPAPEPVAAPLPPAPKPETKPAPARLVTLATYLSRTMFPDENGKYIVSVLRANLSDAPAEGVRLTMTTRRRGEPVERAQSGPAQSLEAGSSSYFGLPVSTETFTSLLDGPADRRSGLEWSLTYRFADDAPGKTRCYRLRALPRRHGPAGIEWLPLGKSQKCD